MGGGGLAGGLFDSISTGALLASVFWGALASGFLIYGWKQKVFMPFVAGVALMVISYFLLNSALYMSLAGIAIVGGFFWLKRQGY